MIATWSFLTSLFTELYRLLMYQRLLTNSKATALLLFLCYLVAPFSNQPHAFSQLKTVAEASKYQRTSRHREVIRFAETLSRKSEHVRQITIGSSVEKRPITALVLAKPMIAQPEDLADDDRLVVFLVGNIHAGECSGKEAVLSLCRDISTGTLNDLLKDLVIVAIPNLNTDANEQQGKHHRHGQVGPAEGTGLRENSQGLDLNRDFIKLETPEIQALVGAINHWNPHLLIDTHTTNGSRHRYALTYDIPNNPAAPLANRKWLRSKLLPEVTQSLKRQGIATTYYGNFNKERSRWITFGHEPRYSSEYMGLRGRLAILSEAYSYIPYQDRILAHASFISKTLQVLSGQRSQVAKLLEKSQTAPNRYSLQAKNGPFPEKIRISAYEPTQNTEETSALAARDYNLEHYANYKSTLEVDRPYAYVLGPDYSRTAQRLLWHGVEMHQVTQAQATELQRYRITKINRSTTSYQGHRTTSVEVTESNSTESIAIGSYVAFTDQPLAVLLGYLLEPLSDDGLTTWNFFERAIREGSHHPVARIRKPVRLITKRITAVRPQSRLTLDQIYGPRGRVSFGGSFPLSLRWIAKTDDYLVRVAGVNYHVDAESGARHKTPRRETAAAQKALASLLDITMAAASKLVQQGQLAPDEQSTLYRHNNDLILYDHEAKKARQLTSDKLPKKLVTFSPDSKHLAFVKKNNLITLPTRGGAEVPITNSGSETFLNGHLDWVYQEELYGRGNFRGFWWSPDSKKLAFLQLDERPVAKYTIADHLAYREKSEATYYPKAGDPIPKASLAIYQLGEPQAEQVDLTSHGDDFLISHVNWSPNGRALYFQIQNREQTWLDLCTVATPYRSPRRLFREQTGAWVQSPGPPHSLPDGTLLWLSEASGYRHIYHITRNGKRKRSLTQGSWEVQKLLGVDQPNGYVYFLGNKVSGTEAHAYRIPLSGGPVTQLTKTAGNHAIRFNDSFSHYIDYVSGMHRPISVSLHRADGTTLRSLAPNLVDYLSYYDLNEPEFFRYKARDGHSLSGVLIKPSDFDPDKQYPVLCHVYGGPQAPVVRNRWGGSTYLWHQYLAQQGYVIWISDNRASTHEGVRSAWTIHKEMGKTELQDLEDGINWLSRNSWIDRKRIGIWGWSYGGYLVSYAMTHSKLFRAGIAGAPVTDWRNYDAIYTERYMGLPKDNQEGYKKASPVHAAAGLHGRLLLIHGALDDNVHLSNTLQFSNALQNAGKQFEMMIYPNNRHGITRPGQSRHLRELMTEFIRKNL